MPVKIYSDKQIIFRPTQKQEDALHEIVSDKNFCYSNAIRGKSDIVRKHFDDALRKLQEEKDAYNFRKSVS